MDIVQKLQQLVESLPEDVMANVPDDTKVLIIKKFGGDAKGFISPKVKKVIQIIDGLSDEEKQQLMENCPLHGK